MIRQVGYAFQDSFHYRVAALAICLVLLLSCGNLPLSSLSSGEIESFTCTFDDGDLSAWQLEQGQPGLIEIVDNPVRAGANALKITVLPGITWGSGNRTELAYKAIFPYKSEMYYGFSLMLGIPYEESGEWQIMGQWHDQPDISLNETWTGFPKNSPPVSIQYENGLLFVDIQERENNYAIKRSNSIQVNKGEWIDIVIHVKWSMEYDGFVEAWFNGKPLFPSNGDNNRIYAPTVINKAGNYFKIGLYRDKNASTKAVLYYDEVRIGNSYAEVAP